jgi:hypothetical protein
MAVILWMAQGLLWAGFALVSVCAFRVFGKRTR